MSTIIITHGTSYNRAKEIIANGFGFCKTTIWNCSDDTVTYFYQVDKLATAEGIENDDLQTQIEFALGKSNESAQIASALESHPFNRTVVFEIHIELNKDNEEEILKHIEPDTSCCNMDDIAVCIEDKILNKWISERIAIVTIHEYDFCSKIALIYLVNLQENEYLQEELYNISDTERFILKALKRVDLPWDEMLELNEIKVYSLT